MVLYDIACGLLSKSLSIGATYTLPIMLVCIWLVLHFASRFYYFIHFISFSPWAQILIVSPGQRPHCPSCYKQGVFLQEVNKSKSLDMGRS